jgi:transposase
VGLRNYLFIGHPDAGWRSAVIYSVVGTCRLLGVNPEAYLLWVLPQLAAATNKTAVSLLPHDFARLQRQTAEIKACESSPSS